MTLAEARQKRHEAKRMLLEHIDPGQQRRQQKQAAKAAAAETFGALADEFIERQRAGQQTSNLKEEEQWK